jgi:signal peptidase I
MPVYPKLLNSQGYSMYPVLLANDVIQVTPISPHDLNIDDIVVFAKKSHYVTHRLVYISKNRSYGITKGDNNLLPDSPIRLRQIKGTILRIYRKNQSLDLKNYYLFQSTYYFDEIKKFKKKLEKQSICYVFLKGLPLHLHFFNQYPQRIFSDCDILIRKESFHQIEVI